MYASKHININEHAKIDSRIQNECTPSINQPLYHYECMSLDFDAPAILHKDLINHYNNQYRIFNSKYKAKKTRDMVEKIMETWSVFIISLDELKLTEATVRGPRVGVCANNINMTDS